MKPHYKRLDGRWCLFTRRDCWDVPPIEGYAQHWLHVGRMNGLFK